MAIPPPPPPAGENLGELTGYDVLVCRTAYAHRTIRVRAASVREAEEAALAVAGDQDFTATDAEYSVEATSKVGPRTD